MAEDKKQRATKDVGLALPTVAVVMPVRNERERLPALLESLERQSLQPTEFLIVDGASDDGSREWLEDALRTRPRMRVLNNPAMVIPAALNQAAQTTSANILARMDAHADYDSAYLERIVAFLAAHPEAAGAGGTMDTVGDGAWGGAIAAQLRRRWAMGGAPHRVGGKGGPVEHVFCTAYRRDAVLQAGGWDRCLLANEDAELDYRVRAVAGEIWLVPEAKSTWRTRRSPTALAKQMWRYGYYRARTIHLHPESLKLRHLAPPLLVVGVVGAVGTRRRAGTGAAVAYASVCGALGAISAKRDGASAWRGGLALPVIHLAWGSGMLVGLVHHVRAAPHPGLADAGSGIPAERFSARPAKGAAPNQA